MFGLGVPMTPELASANEASFAALHTALDPYLTGRTFFNFLGSSEDPRRAFSDRALQRLEQVKRHTDPAGVFRSNRPYLRAA